MEKWWSENHTYLFKAWLSKNILYRNIQSCLNRHIFKWNIEKGTTLTASRRIDKCPTNGQRVSDKFPTAGTNKMGTLGIDWAIIFFIIFIKKRARVQTKYYKNFIEHPSYLHNQRQKKKIQQITVYFNNSIQLTPFSSNSEWYPNSSLYL